MEILGIGASELVFIILIAIIVMGPGQMKQAGKTIGHWLNRINQSEIWKIFRDTSQELSNLPRKWMREANMELWEAEQDLRITIDPRQRRPVSESSSSHPERKKTQASGLAPGSENEQPSQENGENSSTRND